MQVLDADRELKLLARASATIGVRDGLSVLEAEDADWTGEVVTRAPDPAWTGESLWSGQQVVAGAGSALAWRLPDAAEARLVQPVLALEHGSDAVVAFSAGRRPLGTVRVGATGAPGDAASDVRLTQVALARSLAAGERELSASVRGGTARLDALLVMPEVARLAASGTTGSVLLLTSKAAKRQWRRVELSGRRVEATSYDRNGVRTARGLVGGRALVEPGGFTLIVGGR